MSCLKLIELICYRVISRTQCHALVSLILSCLMQVLLLLEVSSLARFHFNIDLLINIVNDLPFRERKSSKSVKDTPPVEDTPTNRDRPPNARHDPLQIGGPRRPRPQE